MAAFLLLVLAAVAVVVFVKVRNASKRQAFEASAAADPLSPAIAAVLRTEEDWRARRAAYSAVRRWTPHILALLERHQESPLLVLHSNDSVFGGLLIVTQGRTVVFGRGADIEVEHRNAFVKTMSTGENRRCWTEVRHGGRVIRFSPHSLQECRLVYSIVDLWADNPEVVPDPRVRFGRNGIEIDDSFFVDMLRSTGHAVTPFNLRSIYERFGMQLHTLAVRYIASNNVPAAEHSFRAAAARPVDDRDLPGWPVRVMREWNSLNAQFAPVAAFSPLRVRSLLLASARTDGYLAHPERPLAMWKSDWYDDGGRGARRSIPA